MINSYEELMSLVDSRRNDRLVLEVELGNAYSSEHEEAKKELAQAKALRSITGEQQFLSDNIEQLEARVAETKPEASSVWVAYRRLDLAGWAALTKQANLSTVDQYEKVLPKTFLGIYNEPEAEVPLSDDYNLVSTKSNKAILFGGAMNAVINAFMSWQNSGGDVSIHPTKSGQD